MLGELLWELGDIDIGAGTLQATNMRLYEAVQPMVTLLREWVQDQPLHLPKSAVFDRGWKRRSHPLDTTLDNACIPLAPHLLLIAD